MLFDDPDVVLIINPSAPDLEITTSVEETEKPNCPVTPTLGTAVVPTSKFPDESKIPRGFPSPSLKTM